MISLLLVLMLVQDQTLEQTIDSFLKGDEAARAELVKQGAYAIRPLQKVRDQNPQRIQGLLREIKKRVAYPALDPALGTVRSSMTLSVNLGGRSDLSPLVQVLSRMEVPCFSDRFEAARLANSRIVVRNLGGIEIIEEICRQTGLDYAYFHGTVVIGMPERLWPVRGAKAAELDDAGRAKAKTLVEQLGNESIEVRENATRELIQLGSGVASLLRDHLDRDDAEIASRCAAVLKQVTAHGVAFGPSACLRQQLPAEDRPLLDRLRAKALPIKFDNAKISDIAAQFSAQVGTAIEVAGVFGSREVTIYNNNQTFLDLLSLITQTWDLDFVIQDRKVLIDSRDRIEKLVPREK